MIGSSTPYHETNPMSEVKISVSWQRVEQPITFQLINSQPLTTRDKQQHLQSTHNTGLPGHYHSQH